MKIKIVGEYIGACAEILTPRKHAALENSQEESRRHKPAPIFDEALADHHKSKHEHAKRHYIHRSAFRSQTTKAKTTESKRTPNMRLELLEQNIRRNLTQDIRHEEDRQCRVVLGALHDIQVGLEPQNGRITDVDTAHKTISGRMSQRRGRRGIRRAMLTGPERQAGTTHTSTAGCASRSWPSAGARWWS